MESKLYGVLNQFRFELNDEATRSKVVDAFYEFLNQDISVKEYAVRCDENNNTPESIAAFELRVDVRIRETGTEEFSIYNLMIGPKKPEELDDQSNPD
jgi:hypothetical protein